MDLPQFQLFLYVISVAYGACIGSFLNVCIYRIPRELSTVKPRSHCPQCETLIPWHLNIPILSYLMLKGRCRFCKGRISPRYVLVELLVAVLFLLVTMKYTGLTGKDPAFGLVEMADWKLIPVYWMVMAGLVLGTFVDFEHMIIPDRVTLGGIVAGLALSLVVPSLHQQTLPWKGLLHAGIGAAVGWGILWAVAFLGRLAFKKDAMGFGDVKLMGAIGAFMGWKAVLFTLVGSSFAGSIVGITLVLIHGRKMQSRIPYGPYLALAAVVWVFWGPLIVDAYLNLLRPEPALL